MTATANRVDSSMFPHYPAGDNDLDCPKLCPSPWLQVVRGETESACIVHHEQNAHSTDVLPTRDSPLVSPRDYIPECQLERFEGRSSDSNSEKKASWSKSSNDAVEGGLVMGAISWPALSDSTRVSVKYVVDSSKAPLEESPIMKSQDSGVFSSQSSRKYMGDSSNPNLSPNNSFSARQGSSKQSGVSLTSKNGLSVTPAIEKPHSNPSPKDHSHRGTNREYGKKELQLHGSQDQTQQRNLFRRYNGSPHLREDAYFHHGYGGRRDHEVGNHRNFNGSDAQLQLQRGFPRAFVTPPSPSLHTLPFVAPLPVRPFRNPMDFDMGSTMVYLPHDPSRVLPFMPQMPPYALIFPALDPQLHTKIVNQIEYYFSNDNLIKDAYLRQNMDGQGWVPVKLIAGFKKVKDLTDNIPLILDILRTSETVQVQGDKLRRRHGWLKWIIPPIQFTRFPGSQSFGRVRDEMIASDFRNFSLHQALTVASRSSGMAETGFSGVIQSSN